jgi:predicted O-methyltransferase YrrM
MSTEARSEQAPALSGMQRQQLRVQIALRRVRERWVRRRLLRSMPRGAVCAEIGVWKGDGTAAILRHAAPRKLYLVDPWEHLDHQDRARAGTRSQEQMDEICDSVAGRFAKEIDGGRVELIRARSEHAWDRFAAGELDWVWLDGDHTYEAVRSDLEALARIVKPGGFIIGDDYMLGWWGDGVIRAVGEFSAEGARSLEVIAPTFFKVALG